MIIRRAVPDGDDLSFDLGDGHHLRFYPDHTVRFEHPCRVILHGDEPEQLVCAPALVAGHSVTVADGTPTVTPSILCPDCGVHGFVTDGVWRDV